MNKIYYLNIKNKNLGPFSKEDINSKISNGDLNEDSYIFVKGTKAWVFLKDLDIFKEELKSVEKNTIKRWLVRKDKSNLGPYSINNLIDLIESGDIDLDDYAWSKGLDKWIPLRTLDELCTKNEDNENTIVSIIPEIENVKTLSKEEIKKTNKYMIKLIPELLFAFVLMFFAINANDKMQMLYLLIASILLMLIFIYKNFFLRRNKKQ